MVALEVHDRHMAQSDITDFPMILIAAVSGRDRYPQSNLPIYLAIHLSLKNQLMMKS